MKNPQSASKPISISKVISRIFIVISFLLTMGIILIISFFALVMAIPGSSHGEGLMEKAMVIVIIVDVFLFIVNVLFHRFLWKIKIHKD